MYPLIFVAIIRLLITFASMWSEFKKTLSIAGPMIIANISQVGLGLLDSAMIGVVDYKQLAASSLVINLLGIPQVICIGITMAISPLVAMANGRNDVLYASKVVVNGLLLTTLVSLLVVVALVSYPQLLFNLGQDPEVARISVKYYHVMSWSLIPMMIFMAVKQFTDALEFT